MGMRRQQLGYDYKYWGNNSDIECDGCLVIGNTIVGNQLITPVLINISNTFAVHTSTNSLNQFPLIF